MDKKYCFAYNDKKNNCNALKHLYCEINGVCNFYKTQGTLDNQYKKIKENKGK